MFHDGVALLKRFQSAPSRASPAVCISCRQGPPPSSCWGFAFLPAAPGGVRPTPRQPLLPHLCPQPFVYAVHRPAPASSSSSKCALLAATPHTPRPQDCLCMGRVSAVWHFTPRCLVGSLAALLALLFPFSHSSPECVPRLPGMCQHIPD